VKDVMEMELSLFLELLEESVNIEKEISDAVKA